MAFLLIESGHGRRIPFHGALTAAPANDQSWQAQRNRAQNGVAVVRDFFCLPRILMLCEEPTSSSRKVLQACGSNPGLLLRFEASEAFG